MGKITMTLKIVNTSDCTITIFHQKTAKAGSYSRLGDTTLPKNTCTNVEVQSEDDGSLKKTIVLRRDDKNDHRIRVKIRGDSGFEVVRDDIPGLKCELDCEDTCNATLTVNHKQTQTGWRPPGSLGGGLTFGGVHPFTIGTGQQPMSGGATGPHSPTPGGAVHTSAHTVPMGAPYSCTSELHIHVHVHVHSN